jgi:hypothetical protein
MADQNDNIEPITEEVPKSVNPVVELGVSGLKRSVGTVDEEFLPQLRGRRGIAVYREMRENSPIVGALMFAIDRLLRQVEWKVVPAGTDTPQAREQAEFLEEVRDDMSHTWDEFITEALTMCTYGWAFHEIVYKRREGPHQTDPSRRSKYSDGKVGIRKIPLRAQETLLRWAFDETGGIKAMVQMAPPLYKTAVIPIEKGLLFRTMAVKNNPEGYSLLRNSYRPWYFMKRAEEQEAIGIERDLAGMPVIKLPRHYLSASPQSDEGKMVDAMRKMVRNIRRNEQEGVLFPTEIDPETKMDDFSFELMGGGGTRQFNTDAVIRRYAEQILMSVIADFIMLGSGGGGGSYAMHTDKSGLFRASINSLSQGIADVMNRHMVPRLWKLNGWDTTDMPRFEPSNIDPPDLGQLAQLIGTLSGSGMTFFPDGDLEDFVRQAAHLPQLGEAEKKGRDMEQAQSDLLRIAQQRMEMAGIRQQADQQVADFQARQQAEATGVQPPPAQDPSAGPPSPGSPAPPAPSGQPDVPAAQPPAGPPTPPSPPGTPPNRPFGKRLDPVHGERLDRLKTHPLTNQLAEAGEKYPAGTPLGMVGRGVGKVRRKKRILRPVQQPAIMPPIDTGGPS